MKQVDLPSCVYPMFVFAAHTGARRSEILRSEIDDIDIKNRTIRIREKKRARGRLTTRLVPMTNDLFEVLESWISQHLGFGPTFFLDKQTGSPDDSRSSIRPLTLTEARDNFRRALAKSKWSPIRGWHVFRHSYCSNCAAAGVDQRLINAWVGHQTEDMVKRYRHLIPTQQQEAITRVFSSGAVEESRPPE